MRLLPVVCILVLGCSASAPELADDRSGDRELVHPASVHTRDSGIDVLSSSQPPRRQVKKRSPIALADVTADTGIEFCHTDGSSGARYIMETVASGVATFDYDQDGLIDIYFLNGAPLRGADPTKHPKNRLYRNLGEFRFIDVTEQAGVGDEGYALAVAVGDYDADGFPDIYLSNFGPNVMYRNNGDGTFTDVTRQTGTAAGGVSKVGAGTSFLDADGNGDLDLFV